MLISNKSQFIKDSLGEEMATVLELTVNNHPGVMSHICGLFSRRAYNVEGIVCVPIGNGELSRIRFRLNESEKLAQVVKQLQKLPDVISVEQWEGDQNFFSGLIDKESYQAI